MGNKQQIDKDPELNRLTRRSFLQRAGLLGLGISFGGGVLQACGQGGSGQGGNSTSESLLSLPTSDNIYFDGWKTAAQAAGEALGMGIHYENYDFDTSKQIASFNNMTNLGLRGSITSANSAAASPNLMRICQQQQIYGINTWSNQPFDTPLDVGEYYLNYLETATDGGFEALCTYLFEEMGGEGKVIHISGVSGNLSSYYRDLGVDRALEKFPDIELVGRQDGGYSRVTTTPVVQNMLTANSGVDAIICQNDDSAIGAMTVLQNKGIEALVVGGDGVPEMLDAIDRGDALATMVHSGPWLGAATVALTFDALNGVELDPLERMLRFEGFVLNTPKAARAYKDLMYSGKKFPFDYKKMSRHLHPDDWDMQHAIVPIRPEEYWSTLEDKRPAEYEFPDEYRNATDDDYGKVEAKYRSHLGSPPHYDVVKLCEPAPIPQFFPREFWS